MASRLGLPVPRKGEFISVRVHPALPGAQSAHIAEINGTAWRAAELSDPVVDAPRMNRSGRSPHPS